MSSIDERVVEMKFNNSDFQNGVKSTLDSLDKLNKNLQLQNGTRGLENVNAAAKNVDLSHIAAGVDAIKNKFNTMSVVGIAALASIVNKAVDAGIRITKAFTLDPVHLGFSNYEEQINAVQTILANTGLKGQKGLGQVNTVLQDLNTYANQTVYNFSEMAKNIGTFTAAGVKLKPAAGAIKGIANLAAFSGANSQQASSAMYQLSQALAANQVKLQDWNSVVNAGIGGKAFQTALFNTGVAMHRIKGVKLGETYDQWTKSGHTFRQSLQDGWINAKVLSTTLQGFTGDMTTQQLKAAGYNKQQIAQIKEWGKTATEAATKIKTISQLKDALREEVGTAYASVFKTLFGDINQAKSWLSPLHVFLENMLTNPIYAINRVLQGWAKLGGRVEFIEAMKTGFNDLKAILAPIKAAFKEIFPATTAQTLKNLTDGLKTLVDHLKISSTNADKLRRIFAGVFAILDIGWQFVKALAHFLLELLGTVAHTSRGLLDFTAKLGDFFVKLDKAIKKGHGFTVFFEGLRKLLTPLLSVLGITRIKMLDLANGVATGSKTFISVISEIPKILHKIQLKIHEVFSNIFSGFNFEHVLQLFNAGLFAGLLLLVRKFLNHLTRDKSGEGIKGFLNKIIEPFNQLTETLKAMQKAIMAATILEIAVAVGILTASVIALSFVDPKKLATALGALTVMFTQLVGALYLLKGVGGVKGLTATSTGLILFATALRILTSSVKALAELSWKELAKGLVGVTVLLGALVLTTQGMSKSAGGMIRTGAGLTILAVGIKILASAVKDISDLSWGEIAKGLVGIGALLGSLAIFTRLVEAGKAGVLQGAGLLLLAAGIKLLASAVDDFGKMHWENIGKGLVSIGAILGMFAIFSRTIGKPTSMVASGAALILVAGAMNLLAFALAKFGNMNWENIAKGLLAMGGSLAIIVAAMAGMEGTLPGAAAMVLISGALVTLSLALKVMGGMDWENIAKGLVALGGSLLIINIAMIGMEESLPGAAALLVVAGALAILVPELALLGQLSWGEILKALVGLAGALTIIGVAGLLLTPIIPSLFGLAGSIALLGAGLALVGGAVYLFATGLQILAIAGAGAAAAIKTIFDTIIGLLPTLAKALGVTLVALAQAIAAATPQLLRTSIILLDALLTAINREGPKIAETFLNVLDHLVQSLANHIPKIANNALRMMEGILTAIKNHAGPIVNTMIDIMIRFINSITSRMPDIVTAAVHLIVSFIRGVSSKIDDVIFAGTHLIIKFIEGIGAAGVLIATATLKTMLDFVNGLDAAVVTYEPQLIHAGEKLAGDIVLGIAKGLADIPMRLGKFIGGGLINWARSTVGAHSPAKEFIKLAEDINHGLIIGLVGGHDQIISTWNDLVDKTRAALSNSKDDIKKYTDKLDTLEKAHKKNPKAIRETTAALREANLEHERSSAILTELQKKQGAHYTRLRQLGASYDWYKQKIDDATQSLKAAIQTRDDYSKQVKDQYSTLPDFGMDVVTPLEDATSKIASTTVDKTKTVTALEAYTNSLQYQVNDTIKFAQVVQQLKDMGLNDAAYQALISKGPAALQFAEELLAGGATAVQRVDSLGDQLATAAAGLGQKASLNLYQAGVVAAQGLVNGFVANEKKVEDEMEKIAASLVKTLKKKLKIKSPSQVFHDLGDLTTEGLIQSFHAAAPAVSAASANLGGKAIDAMKQTLSGVQDAMNMNVDMNPVIAPVLDLSSVHKGAAHLNGLFASRQLSVDATYSTAKDASSSYQANKAAEFAAALAGNTPMAPGDITFNQYNTSPKALSPADIYRQTKNQLSIAKGALTSNAA